MIPDSIAVGQMHDPAVSSALLAMEPRADVYRATVGGGLMPIEKQRRPTITPATEHDAQVLVHERIAPQHVHGDE